METLTKVWCTVLSLVFLILQSKSHTTHGEGGQPTLLPQKRFPSVSGTAPQKWLLKLEFEYHLVQDT